MDDVVRRVLTTSRQGSVWSADEKAALERARRALEAVRFGDGLDAVVHACRHVAPIVAGMLDSFRASAPFEPEDVIVDVPMSFIDAVMASTEEDPSPFIMMGLPAHRVARDVDTCGDGHRMYDVPFFAELYPHHGIGHAAAVALRRTPIADDTLFENLWFFTESGSPPLSLSSCRMLEAITPEIGNAVARLDVPAIHGASFLGQILAADDAGFALVDGDGRLLEANRRAFVLAALYRTGLEDLLRCVTPIERQAQYAWQRQDGGGMLCATAYPLDGRAHGLPRRVTLFRLQEETAEARPLPAQLAALSPRRREVAVYLARTSLTYDQIAGRLGIASGTLRKHAEHVYRALGVHSRWELRRIVGG